MIILDEFSIPQLILKDITIITRMFYVTDRQCMSRCNKIRHLILRIERAYIFQVKIIRGQNPAKLCYVSIQFSHV